jgi:hypothetical protein
MTETFIFIQFESNQTMSKITSTIDITNDITYFYQDPDNVTALTQIALFGSRQLIDWIEKVCNGTLNVKFMESENIRRMFNMNVSMGKFGMNGNRLLEMDIEDVNDGKMTVEQLKFYKWVIEGGLLELCRSYHE